MRNPFLRALHIFAPMLEIFRFENYRPHVAVQTRTSGRIVQLSPFGVHRRRYTTGIETLEQFMKRIGK